MTVEIICADAREALAAMPEGSVHTCVTSPPYWGLRDYGLPPAVWGEADCEHEWGEESYQRRSNDGGDSGRKQETNAGAVGRDEPIHHAFCRRCNAWQGTLGLEPTPELYVEHIVQVMREVRRVLRDDGTLWLNLGDSYASQATSPHQTERLAVEMQDNSGWTTREQGTMNTLSPGLKPKDLCGMPWRVAFALQGDGWWLRRDVIWSKKNPMPESTQDRPTTAHEFVFLLTKRARYYYDADAIREPSSETSAGNRREFRGGGTYTGGQSFDSREPLENRTPGNNGNPAGRNKRSVWEIATQPFGLEMCASCKMVYDAARYRRLRSGGAPRCQFEVAEDEKCGGSKFEPLDGTWQCIACDTTYTVKGLQRLPRAARCACGQDDAWIGHFAVFPEKLVEPCILAGTSERGCCPECGAPWERVVERTKVDDRPYGRVSQGSYAPSLESAHGADGRDGARHSLEVTTTGWRPTCDHAHEPIPCTALDPFAGSGTVGVVAERLGRASVLIDAKEEYCEMARHRTAQRGLMVEVAP